MIAAFHNVHTAKLWRAVYFACMPLIVFYIFFEVLDLDGSKFSRPIPPVENSAIITEGVSSLELHDFRDTATPWAQSPRLFGDQSGEFSLLLRTKIFSFSPFVFTRSHGYLVGLPREAVPH
jgi:hypothetical protein